MDSLSKLEPAVYGAAQVLKRLKCRQILGGLDPTLRELNGVLWLRVCHQAPWADISVFIPQWDIQVVLATGFVIHLVQISTKHYD